MGKILIIANARWRGGLSGGDNIYLNFERYWPDVEVWDCMDETSRREDLNIIDFAIFYFMRIAKGCIQAMACRERYEFVYSASDFWMDSLPGLILKLKGNKWVAALYLDAPMKNIIFWLMQKPIKWAMRRYADIICLTNESMFKLFPSKPKIAVHGGVDLQKIGLLDCKKEYDAVFVGRFHHSKGIDELIRIWTRVRDERPEAKLAIIGGGDNEEKKVKAWAKPENGAYLLGYMGEERFEVYKKSKLVLYPATVDHFSMGPVEAMACGCPMVAFDLPVMDYIKPKGVLFANTVDDFVVAVTTFLWHYQNSKNDYLFASGNAFEWAKTWSWANRAQGILEKIKRLL